jgi:hypothetical protein
VGAFKNRFRECRCHFPCLVSSSSAAFIPQLAPVTLLLSSNGMCSLLVTFPLTERLLSQLRPSNSLRCPRPSQSFRTLKSVCNFHPLFLPAFPLQRHECRPRRTFARRLRTHTHARIFSFRFERRRLPRHSISRRVRTKAQLPSTVAVTHSLSFAAPATLRMPIMICMSLLLLSPVFPHLILVFFSSQARTHV